MQGRMPLSFFSARTHSCLILKKSPEHGTLSCVQHEFLLSKPPLLWRESQTLQNGIFSAYCHKPLIQRNIWCSWAELSDSKALCGDEYWQEHLEVRTWMLLKAGSGDRHTWDLRCILCRTLQKVNNSDLFDSEIVKVNL